MIVDVIVTTYNGEKYILKQLESLFKQTRQPDEVYIYDDKSKDNTVEIVRGFIAERQLNNWHLFVNDSNLGWRKNFKVSIINSHADIIFPCDQDDVWEPRKIEVMTQLMENDNKIMLLSSSFSTINGLGETLYECSENGKIEQIKFNEKFALGQRPGCAMAIRNELVAIVKNIWDDEYPHDAFLWSTAVLLDGCYVIYSPLIRYRLHDTNTSSVMNHNAGYAVKSLERGINIAEWGIDYYKSNQIKTLILKNYIEFARLRMELIKNKRILNWFRLFKYRKYYRSTRQQFGDWLYILTQKVEDK